MKGCFRNVWRVNLPSAYDCVTHKKLLGTSVAGSCVPIGVSFPAIHLDPKVNRKVPTKGVYSCPCYKTTTRAGTLSTTGHSTNFVLMVEVPSKEPCSGTFSKYCETFSAHWIKRAVALFTTLNY